MFQEILFLIFDEKKIDLIQACTKAHPHKKETVTRPNPLAFPVQFVTLASFKSPVGPSRYSGNSSALALLNVTAYDDCEPGRRCEFGSSNDQQVVVPDGTFKTCKRNKFTEEEEKEKKL